MNAPITYRNFKEDVRGIVDRFSKQELIANDLCRQIFEKYNYTPYKPLNFETSPPFDRIFDFGTDFGIDDVIYSYQLPGNDPLKFKEKKLGRWDDFTYTIDYKSNNMRDLNSVYIKLMPYRYRRQYLPYYERNGEIIDPIMENMKKDKARWDKAIKKGKDHIFSLMELYYNNNQLLSINNKTDFFFFVKYTKPRDVTKSTLKLAHLVPAEELRQQVVRIINYVLRKGEDNQLIKLERDFYLNHKIMKAFQLCKEDSSLINPEMELFKLPRGDITLRIPEHLLTQHIKFNQYGEIINK